MLYQLEYTRPRPDLDTDAGDGFEIFTDVIDAHMPRADRYGVLTFPKGFLEYVFQRGRLDGANRVRICAYQPLRFRTETGTGAMVNELAAFDLEPFATTPTPKWVPSQHGAYCNGYGCQGCQR